ncbi:unnamed protein product [Chilo suppressalis]|uniref:Zinc finger PHD-type domain-containing protein n=1 Tax=Chilo suppressalis TaxID=168631 RepID=A0ABN8AUC4_CHISP|nr:unnamed protein product [Chilo suppressalis]
MTVCSACNKTIKSADKIICSRKTCSSHYHLCVNLTQENDKKQTAWTCPLCNNVRPKDTRDNSKTPVKALSPVELPTQHHASDEASTNVTFRKPTSTSGQEYNQNQELRNDIRAIIKEKLNYTLRALISTEFQTISGLETSVSFVSSQYEDLTKLMMSNSMSLNSLKDENSVLRGNLTARHQQWVRLQNVEIIDVPDDAEDDTANIVLSIAKHIGVDVATNDLEFDHRV